MTFNFHSQLFKVKTISTELYVNNREALLLSSPLDLVFKALKITNFQYLSI
jgi:hypothetical protein